MAHTNPEDVRMSLGDHLDELRKRLLLGLIGPLAAAIVLMFFGREIVVFLSEPIYDAFKANGEQVKLVQREVGEAFSVYLRVSMIGGLIIGIPWLFYQLWKFIAPGLYANERKFVVRLIPGSAVLSFAGVCFAYYVVLPFTLWFLISFGGSIPMPGNGANPISELLKDKDVKVVYPTETPTEPIQLPVLDSPPAELIEGQVWLDKPTGDILTVLGGKLRRFQVAPTSLLSTEISLKEYISFVMWMELGFAAAFQLPMVMIGLAVSNLVSARSAGRVRRFAILAIAIVAAVMTPPDVMSMILMAVPLYLLYEFGIVLMRRVERRRAARDKSTEDGGDGGA